MAVILLGNYEATAVPSAQRGPCSGQLLKGGGECSPVQVRESTPGSWWPPGHGGACFAGRRRMDAGSGTDGARDLETQKQKKAVVAIAWGLAVADGQVMSSVLRS